MTTISEINAFNISDAVKFHKELNPLLWNNKKLDPEVRDQLVLIAEDFVEYLGLSNLKVVDVTVSGSNAAYSYTPHSDIDLHVLVDFSQLPDDPVYQELFTAKKTLYNDAHDITVRNIPVELYVQDTNQPVESLGEYSILHDKWIRIPKKRRANFDQAATKIKYEKLGDLVELALSTKDPKRVNDTIALIRRYRKSGLDKTGEFGPENLAYKAVRKQGLVKALYDLKAQLHTEKLSIEEDTNAIADAIKNSLGLKQLIVTERGNDLFLDSIIVDKKDQGKGLGSKALEQLIDYADQNDKRIILTPGLQNKNHGTTSRNRLVKFYKQFGFKENKGRSIDYAMGAGKMYRDPKSHLQEKEHTLLNNPTMSVSELAEKHNVPRMEIAAQLDKGIKVELEHTDNKSVAREIALDHLLEDPKYYDKLAKIGLEEEISDLSVWKNPSPRALHNLTKKSAHKRMRGLYHDGITYWWDANDAIHAQGAKYLGIPYNYLTRMEAGIDSISDNYSVGGDDEVPPAVIQRYDIENEVVYETSGYIPNKKAILNSSISQVYMCEGIYYSKDMLLEQQLYEDFMSSAKQFLGAKFNNTMANVKGQVSDLINAGIIIKDVAANPELMTNVTSQVRKWTSQLVKDITSSIQEVGQKLNMPQLTAKLVAAWKFISQKVTEFGSSPGWKGFLGSLGIYGFVKFIHVMLSADKLKSLVAGQVLDKLKARLKATLEGGTLDAIVDKVKDLGTTVASNVTMPGFMEIFKALTLVKQYFLDVLNKVKDKFSSITVAGTPQFSSGVQLEASGYIPSEKEKNDPRFKTALTVDVRPDAIKKNAKAFGFKTSRAGIPPQARADGKISESAIQKLIVQSINGKTFDSELHEVAYLNTLDLHPNVISRMKEALAENSLMESSAHDNNVEQLTRLANSFCAKSMKIGSQYIPVQIDLYKGSLIVYDVFKNSPPSHDAAFGTLTKYDPTENIALVKFNDAVYRYPLTMPLLSLFTTTIFVETAQAYDQLRTMLSLHFNEELPPLGTDDTLNESLMREWQSFLAEDEQQELFPGYDKEHKEKRLDNWLQNTHAWDGHKPRVFYHATTKDFDTFNTHGTGFASALGMAFEVERHGSFFAVDPKFAELFIEDPNTGRPKDGGRVIPVYLSVQNPIDLRDNNLYRMLSDPDTVEGFEANGIDLRSIRYIDEYTRWELFDGSEGAEFVENLQKLGFDGAIIVESIPNNSNAKSGEVWVVFNPNQVKSVYNRGSFSPDDARLMKESGQLEYLGNCTEDDVVDDIFGNVSEFARVVEEHGDEFTLGNLVVKYDDDQDIHYFYKNSG